MVKYIYRIVITIVAFVAALIFFGHNLQTDINDTGNNIKITDESFPSIQIMTQGEKINMLYGYSTTLNSSVIRESMVPVAIDKKIALVINKGTSYLTEISYQIIDKESGDVYDTQTIHGISKNQQMVDITFNYNFKTSTEYILDITGTTNTGREIHYYTRLKYYLDNSFLDKKMNFVKRFHESTFDKSKREEIQSRIETTGTSANNNLAHVDIKSSSDLITWGEMVPEVVSEKYITIKEYNMETACIQYNYFVKAKSSSGTELYHIKEFYRVRYANGRSYLLNFTRDMEAQFDIKQTSPQRSIIKTGITNETDDQILSNGKQTQIFFARGDNLYKYDMKNNKLTTAFSFYSEKASYRYKAYNEQAIRLLKVDEADNLYFCAYGYFPRGRYEGDVGIVLFEYTNDNELKELVYMPIDSSYQQLKEDFENYGYVSTRGIYYFTVANNVYSYNMSAKRLEKIAENVKKQAFMTIKNLNCYVWSSSYNTGFGDSITIFNLESDERQTLYKPDESSYIRLLGVIEENVVYGYVKKDDVKRLNDGTLVVPCYKIFIADTQGNVKREYSKNNKYIQSIDVKGNVMNIALCSKRGNSYKINDGEDSILNQGKSKKQKFSYTSRYTAKCLTEWYIGFPSSFTMNKLPKLVGGPKSVNSNDRTVRLELPDIPKYYVYAGGQITGAYESAATAIKTADSQMGVVISSNHKVVWERSGAFIQNSIGGINLMESGNGVGNLAACAHMVLKQNHVSVDAKELTNKHQSIYNMLAEYMQQPVNLKGCSLEQILYFVSNNKSVIAMTGDNSAVVIGGYTAKKLSLYDPTTSKVREVSRREYEKVFKNAGNRFISYMSQPS